MHLPCARHASSVGRRAGPGDLAVWVARAPTGALRDPGGLHSPGGRGSSGSREQGAKPPSHGLEEGVGQPREDRRGTTCEVSLGHRWRLRAARGTCRAESAPCAWPQVGSWTGLRGPTNSTGCLRGRNRPKAATDVLV